MHTHVLSVLVGIVNRQLGEGQVNKSLVFNTLCEPGIQSRSMGIPCPSENMFDSTK